MKVKNTQKTRSKLLEEVSISSEILTIQKNEITRLEREINN